MENFIALFVSKRESFFKEKASINCSIDKFCACDDTDSLFDVDRVMRKKLIDIGEGVQISEPINVEMGLLVGNMTSASLSHQGVLAICVDGVIQLINLKNDRQVKIEVKKRCFAGFYDSMILLLTWKSSLKEALVECVFNNPMVETFNEIKETNNVYPWTDVSLLHERRLLYYHTMDSELFSFNVDTKKNIKIDVGRRVSSIASFTGIDCKMKVLFKSDDNCTYALKMDNTMTMVNEGQEGYLRTFFPSISSSNNINNAVFKYDDNLIKAGNHIDASDQIEFDIYYSVIRIYRNIFLAYNEKINSWTLFHMIVV